MIGLYGEFVMFHNTYNGSQQVDFPRHSIVTIVQVTLITVFISCQRQHVPARVIAIPEAWETTLGAKTTFDEIFEKVAETPLQTPDSIIIGQVGDALTEDRNGNIYIIDMTEKSVVVFDSTGKYVRHVGKKGSGPTDFRLIRGVYYNDVDDRLYVCDPKLKRVSVFDRNSTLVSTINVPNQYTWKIYVDSLKNLYLFEPSPYAEFMFAVYNQMGIQTRSFGQKLPEKFKAFGNAIGGDYAHYPGGFIYVDIFLPRVFNYSESGEELTDFPIVNPLYRPVPMEFAPDSHPRRYTPVIGAFVIKDRLIITQLMVFQEREQSRALLDLYDFTGKQLKAAVPAEFPFYYCCRHNELFTFRYVKAGSDNKLRNPYMIKYKVRGL